MNATILNPEIVEGLRMMSAEHPAIFGRITASFAQNSEDLLRQLGDASSNEDYDSLARIAHSLKGSAGSLGSRKVSDLCVRIERDAKLGDWLSVRQQVMEELPAELDQFRKALDDEIM